jgi:hypothetical protein
VRPGLVIDALRESLMEQQRNRQLFGADYQDPHLSAASPMEARVLRNQRRNLGVQTRFHYLRPGHASQALQDGVPIKTFQERPALALRPSPSMYMATCFPAPLSAAAESPQRTLGAAIEKRRQKTVN